MKKCIIITLLVAAITTVVCSKSYTRLILVFGEQPEGGRNVTQLLTIVVAHLEDGDIPITVRFRWLWRESLMDSAVIYYSETRTIKNEEPEELWCGVQAPGGYVLDGYFWFEADWEDEDGTPQLVASDTAYCYTSALYPALIEEVKIVVKSSE